MRFLTRLSLALGAICVAGACNYTFSGGGGLPSHVKTIYVAPINNQTTQFALTEDVTRGLLDAATGKFYLQPGTDAHPVHLNGVAVEAPTELRRGDRLQVGVHEFEFLA